MRKSQVKKLFLPIEIDVYSAVVFIAVNLTNEELTQSLLDSNINPSIVDLLVEASEIGEADAMTGEYRGISVMRYSDMKSLKDIGLITHESFHATSSLLRYIKLPLSYKSEEAYAYLLGYIVDKYKPYT
jgi:hypothetical protein